MQIPQIEPFQFIRSTAFSERVQLANKINEIIDGINSIGEIPDLENQITELTAKVTELEDSIGNTDTSLAELENQVNALISEVNTTIKQAISALESDVEGIDTRLTTAEGTISEHGTEIDGLLKEVIDSVVVTSDPHGTVQVQINHEDGSNDISAPIDLGLVEQGGIVLQSGTTDRSFKLIVTLTDGTSWQTNDFVIPEGGGTDVSVTSISIAQGTGADKIQVKIGLSDGSTISSNDWTVVTPSEFSALGTRVTTAEGNITKNTGDISDLDTRVQALEDSPGFTLQPATATTLGGVKIGAGITVQSDGTIAVDKTQINTAAVASTVMFTADTSKVTLHADSIAGSEFTEDIPQASQGGAGTIDQASYAKIAATEAKLNALTPTVTVNEDVSPPQITVAINGKSSTANLPNTDQNPITILKITGFGKGTEASYTHSNAQNTKPQVGRDDITPHNVIIPSLYDDSVLIALTINMNTSGTYYNVGIKEESYSYIGSLPLSNYVSDFNDALSSLPDGSYSIQMGCTTNNGMDNITDDIPFTVSSGVVNIEIENVNAYSVTNEAHFFNILPSSLKKR